MKKSVSLGKIIREMDAQELEDFLLNIWKIKCGRNTQNFLSEYASIIKKCETCYYQLTNKKILTQISKEIEQNT